MMHRNQTSEKGQERNGFCGVSEQKLRDEQKLSGQKCRALSLGLALSGSIFLALSLGGCGTGFDLFPEKSSHAGAATGGAIGAGLGAVIGSQTGDAFGGAAIGALAGAGAGYAIGDAVSERDDRYTLQQQTIERQAAMLRAQQAEIDELRRLSGDGGSYGDRVSYSERAPYQNNGYVGRELPDYGKTRSANQIANTQIASSQNATTRRYIDPATLKNPFAASSYSSSANYPATTGYSRGYSYDSSMVARNNVAPSHQLPSSTVQGSYSYRNPSYRNPGTSETVYPRAGSSAVVGSSLSAAVPTNNAVPTNRAVRTTPSRVSQAGVAPSSAAVPSAALPPVSTTASARRTSSTDMRQKTAMNSSSKAQDVRGALQPAAAAEVAGSRALEESAFSKTSKGSASVGIALEVPEKTSNLNESSAVLPDSKTPSVSPAVVGSDAGAMKTVDSSFNDCKKGESEARVAASSDSLIDKLFYLRRAQRFCPNEPKWYVELGKVYTSLGRSEDAKTQYEDALQLQSDYAPAKNGLKELEEAVY